jgi:hypothetical protein
MQVQTGLYHLNKVCELKSLEKLETLVFCVCVCVCVYVE